MILDTFSGTETSKQVSPPTGLTHTHILPVSSSLPNPKKTTKYRKDPQTNHFFFFKECHPSVPYRSCKGNPARLHQCLWSSRERGTSGGCLWWLLRPGQSPATHNTRTVLCLYTLKATFTYHIRNRTRCDPTNRFTQMHVHHTFACTKKGTASIGVKADQLQQTSELFQSFSRDNQNHSQREELWLLDTIYLKSTISRVLFKYLQYAQGKHPLRNNLSEQERKRERGSGPRRRKREIIIF